MGRVARHLGEARDYNAVLSTKLHRFLGRLPVMGIEPNWVSSGNFVVPQHGSSPAVESIGYAASEGSMARRGDFWTSSGERNERGVGDRAEEHFVRSFSPAVRVGISAICGYGTIPERRSFAGLEIWASRGLYLPSGNVCENCGKFSSVDFVSDSMVAAWTVAMG